MNINSELPLAMHKLSEVRRKENCENRIAGAFERLMFRFSPYTSSIADAF